MEEVSRPHPEEVEHFLLNARLRDELEPYMDEAIMSVNVAEVPTPVENDEHPVANGPDHEQRTGDHVQPPICRHCEHEADGEDGNADRPSLPRIEVTQPTHKP